MADHLQTARILIGDCVARLREIESGSVQTCVTSPPYWRMRDYGVDGQIGLEQTPQEFVERLVGVFREVRRVLRDDGTLWINIGDTSAYSMGACGKQGKNGALVGRSVSRARQLAGFAPNAPKTDSLRASGLKPKDLVGIPWMLAFALRADGWYLRSEIIWHKPNPIPDSARDRPGRSHETVFLLSKSRRYFYDSEAVRTPLAEKTFTAHGTTRRSRGTDGLGSVKADNIARDMPTRKPRVDEAGTPVGANLRSVWTIAPNRFTGSHFAVMPQRLAEICILAGSRSADTVLDPFNGAGTTGLVALRNRRSYVGVELNPGYAAMTERRLRDEVPLLADVRVELPTEAA